MRVSLILTTIGAGDAVSFSRMLIERKLAACVERIGVDSCYEWNGEICDEPETSLLIKTVHEKKDACVAAIEQEHPYDCPQILAFDGESPFAPYSQFMRKSVGMNE